MKMIRFMLAVICIAQTLSNLKVLFTPVGQEPVEYDLVLTLTDVKLLKDGQEQFKLITKKINPVC